MTNEIAERYGQGLLELARETDTVRQKKEQAEFIVEQMKQNDEIALFFQAVKISKEEKKNFVEQVFSKYVDRDMVNLMKLAIDKGRSYYLQSILEQYIVLADDTLGIVHASVTSARALSKEDMQSIHEALVSKYQKDIVLKNIIDPSLIAGIKVTINNSVTDISTKAKIDEMKRVLLKGGQA